MPNIHETVRQMQEQEIFADKSEEVVRANLCPDFTHSLGIFDPVPTGWNTKVENPGDRKRTKKEKQFAQELSRRQGGEPSYATVSQGADLNVSPYLIYSNKGEK